jgi:hypothetical protein
MKTNFSEATCQDKSVSKLFGLCDTPPPLKGKATRAYIDELNGGKWVAIVENEYLIEVTFTAVDNCVELKNTSGIPVSRCDGMLTYNSTVVFVELKQRKAVGNDWVKDADRQLRSTIDFFEDTEESDKYTEKRAYIANSEHPKAKFSQTNRMEKFKNETGYTLRIMNRIRIE